MNGPTLVTGTLGLLIAGTWLSRGSLATGGHHVLIYDTRDLAEYYDGLIASAADTPDEEGVFEAASADSRAFADIGKPEEDMILTYSLPDAHQIWRPNEGPVTIVNPIGRDLRMRICALHV